MMETVRRVARRAIGELTLTPARAWAVGGVLVLLVGVLLLNPVDRPLRIGSPLAADTDTSAPADAQEWASPDWSDTDLSWTSDVEWADPLNPTATTPQPLFTPDPHTHTEDDVTPQAGQVIAAWQTIYHNPPAGGEVTDEWLAALEPFATPTLLAATRWVDPSLIPVGDPGEPQWVKVSPTYVEAEYRDPAGQLVQIAAQTVDGETWLVSKAKPVGDLDL